MYPSLKHETSLAMVLFTSKFSLPTSTVIPLSVSSVEDSVFKSFYRMQGGSKGVENCGCQKAEGLGTMGNRSSRGENESLGLGDCGRFFEFTAPRVGIVEDIGTTTCIDGIIILANQCRGSGIAEAASQSLSGHFQGVKKSRIEGMHGDQSMEEEPLRMGFLNSE
jgi:hypothetical protein